MSKQQQVIQLNGSKNPTRDEMKLALDTINAVANFGLEEIATQARMACLAFESPEAYRHLDHFAVLLDSISKRARELMNDIGYEAEQMGCTSETDAEKRRAMALRAWCDRVASQGGAA